MDIACRLRAWGWLSISLILCAPSTPAQEADPAVTELTEPDSELNAGFLFVSEDNLHYGQYRGLQESGLYGSLSVDFAKRDDNSGTWLTVDGRNLGLDSRSLEFEHTRQGNWAYFLDYAQLPRANVFEHNTGLEGIGSADLIVNGEALRDTHLETERKSLTLGGSKWFGENLSAHVTARDEAKDGERQFGRGTGGAMEFLSDPIDQHIRQIEATLAYSGKSLQLAGGYYGTDFDNNSAALNVAGGAPELSQGTGAFTPLGLPPDNQSHQVYLAGNYQFTPRVASTFKASYAKATQDDTFIAPSAPGRTDLGGRIDTTFLQLGVTARPMPKLSLLANLRYDDRDDKTPIEDYFTVTTTSTATGENEPRDIRTVFGRIEASYYLPAGFRLTAGFDDEQKKRNTSSVRVVSYREETDEQSYRLELRRTISATLTGELAYVHSDRDGSDFQTTVVTNGTVGSNLVAPLHLADRARDKTRLLLNWMPMEPLSLQFAVNHSDDDYDAGRTSLDLGARSGKMELYSLDATYVFTEDWQSSLWLSRSENQLDQASCVAASSIGVCPGTTTQPVWMAQLSSDEDAYGLSLQGKIGESFSLGADVQYSDIRDGFAQQALTPGAAITSPFDIATRSTTATLYAKYLFSERSAVRFDVTYDRYTTDDWTWSTFTYRDGTHVFNDPDDDIYLVGLSYNYRWQ